MPASLLAFLGSIGAQTPGPTMPNGVDLLNFFKASLGPTASLTALAGGGIPGATQLNLGWNEVDTVATTGDSVVLPPALPGSMVWVNNNGANTLDIYSNQYNYQNPSSSASYQADVVVPPGTTSANSATTALTLTSGYVTLLYCAKLGTWKQFLTAHA